MLQHLKVKSRGMDVASRSGDAQVQLARRLRALREGEWADRPLNQSELAAALKLASSTISSYELPNAPKTPKVPTLTAYAQFFATRRSIEVNPPALTETNSFTPQEQERFDQLRDELLGLHAAIAKDVRSGDTRRRALLSFDGADTVVVVCPEAPKEARGPLADEKSLNHTKLHRFADADALLEVYGHIREFNPGLKVIRGLPSQIPQAELQNHIVLLGGIGWNDTARRILSDLDESLPIGQIDDETVPEGDPFRVNKDGDRDEQTYLPKFRVDPRTGKRELVEDVGLLARLPNPFNFSRTMTICNGIYSTGVLGVALGITDKTVRDANEEYLSKRFPAGKFAVLVRILVGSGEPIAADLRNPKRRLFEWSPEPTSED